MTHYDFDAMSRRVPGAGVRILAPRVTRRQKSLTPALAASAMDTGVALSETTLDDPVNYERFMLGVHGFSPSERWMMT